MTAHEKRYVAGGISATIWINDDNTRVVHLERTYKDKDGKWKLTQVMRINDIPKAQLVLESDNRWSSLRTLR